MNKKHHKKQKGFSLLEALISIAVLTLSITAASSVVQNSLRNATYIKERSQAILLADEAIEYARNMRDSDFLSKDSQYLNDFIDQCDGDFGCELDIISGFSGGNVSYKKCSNDNCGKLIEGDSGFGSTNSNEYDFKRIIKVTKQEKGDDKFEIKTNVSVLYTVYGNERTIELEGYLMQY